MTPALRATVEGLRHFVTLLAIVAAGVGLAFGIAWLIGENPWRFLGYFAAGWILLDIVNNALDLAHTVYDAEKQRETVVELSSVKRG